MTNTSNQKQLTAAIYARVSSEDQSYEMQLTEIREYAARMKWNVVEYNEKMSAAKARPVLARLMQDARLKKIDVVLVYKLDRFGRSVSDIVSNVLILDQHGVRLIAVTQGIDTDQKSPASRLIIHVLAAVAEFERSLIVERVRSGMAQAKRSGKHCGRPTRVWSRDEARKLQAQGMSLRKIASQLGQSEGSIRRGLKTASKG